MVTWIIANIVWVSIGAAVYAAGLSLTLGYITGKKYWQYDGSAQFWAAAFWPLFWVLEILCTSAVKWAAWYCIRYSPFWLAFDLGMWLSGARRQSEAV